MKITMTEAEAKRLYGIEANVALLLTNPQNDSIIERLKELLNENERWA